MERTRILVNSPSVVSEVIEGEAVIMNLGTGQYFSCQGVGGEMWSLIETGATRGEILDHVKANYSVDDAVLTQSFDQFLASLEEYELVRHESAEAEGAEAPSGNGAGGADAGAGGAAGAKGAFIEPLLNVYNDMEDLLLLDPIHDVDETGWPQPKPAEEDAGGSAPENAEASAQGTAEAGTVEANAQGGAA